MMFSRFCRWLDQEKNYKTKLQVDKYHKKIHWKNTMIASYMAFLYIFHIFYFLSFERREKEEERKKKKSYRSFKTVVLETLKLTEKNEKIYTAKV